jgi:LysR family transcriptional regulator, glycine cleavage system transcriptional activator
MRNENNILPPLDYLLAFEAAANNQSFVEASKLLNISETAISRKVRLLEKHYDTLFFLRGHKSISLTPQGQSFLERIHPALQILRDTSDRLLDAEKNKPVTLAATNSVASLWLMPRLRTFNRTNKHLKIMLLASDNDAECLSDEIDLAILRGNGGWPDHHAQLLFGETIFPVCSPDYLKANPDAAHMERLTKLDLIEVASRHVEWMDWKTWLSRKGIADKQVEPAAIFNTYPLAVQAAIDGLGIALGWGHLVDRQLDSGQLVRPLGRISMRTDQGYYLLRNSNSAPYPERRTVENWLLNISAKRKRYKRRDR